MNNKVLITKPNHDKVTCYLCAWSKEITQESYLENYSFMELEGSDANKDKVESYLNKQNPRLVLLNGHGNADVVCGYKDQPLIQVNFNDHLLKGKIVYALSCGSATNLGRTSVEKGAECYIGYEEDFVLVTDAERETTPLKDKIAASFLKPSNKIAISLLKGKTTKESSNKSREEFKKEIKRYLSSNKDDGAEQIASYLLWDMENQAVIGNHDAAISQ